MDSKTLRVVALGLGGLVVALVLTVGAFALAGQQIAQPARMPIFTTSTSPSPGHDDERSESSSPDHERIESPSPSVDDHGGGSGKSSGGSSGSDDGGGSGGHDSSGSGSGDSGSGSGDSSGSGSGEHEDD
jgi:hypothetical protein